MTEQYMILIVQPEWDATTMSAEDWARSLAEHRAFAESLAGQRERHPGVTVDEVVAKGSSARAILAASDDAALIALGTRGRGEFLGALLGSVSQGVLHRAKVPVAVIGPEEGS